MTLKGFDAGQMAALLSRSLDDIYGPYQIPDGYRPVKLAVPAKGELFVALNGAVLTAHGSENQVRLVLEKEKQLVGYNIRLLGRKPEMGELYVKHRCEDHMEMHRRSDSRDELYDDSDAQAITLTEVYE